MKPVLAIFCLTFTVLDANLTQQEPGQEPRQLRPRGYGYAHPFLPFLEPLSILAVLGFIAFIVQTIHAIYHTHTHNHNTGLGLLGNLLPGGGTLHKKLQPEGRNNEDVLKAIQLYEEFNKPKKRKKRAKFVQGDNVKSPTAEMH